MFSLLLGILLLGTPGIAEDYSIDVRVIPSLAGDHHIYYAQLQCPTNETFGPLNEFIVPSSVEGDEYDQATFLIGANDQCPDGYELGIAMFNQAHNEDFEWYTWARMPLLLKGIKFEVNKLSLVQKIEFGNHFKLNISPKLMDSSKIVYRVNVYCADYDQFEFKTYIQSDTVVVFNSIERHCEKYDVEVWPTFANWLDKSEDEKPIWANLFFENEFTIYGIKIKNGKTKHIKIPNLFWRMIIWKITLRTMISAQLMMILWPIICLVNIGARIKSLV